jgi:hypothetical protein
LKIFKDEVAEQLKIIINNKVKEEGKIAKTSEATSKEKSLLNFGINPLVPQGNSGQKSRV